MTCRRRSCILGPPQLCAQANRFLALGRFLRCGPCGAATQAMATSQMRTYQELAKATPVALAAKFPAIFPQLGI